MYTNKFGFTPLRMSLIFIICYLGVIYPLSLRAKTTISYGLWDEEQAKVIKKIIPLFIQKHPDIEVKLQVVPWLNYWTILDAAASGGAMSDVAWMNVYGLGRYVIYGTIKDLTPYIKRDNIDLSNYYKSSISSYKFNGKQYAMPRDLDSITLWYNKEIFDKANIDYPNDNWSWQDLEKASKAIKEKVPNVYPIAMGMAGQNDFINLFHQAGGSEIEPGGKVSGFDKPGTIIALKWLKKIMNLGYIPNAKSLSGFKDTSAFASNKAAMIYMGSWAARPIALNSLINQKIGIAELPSYKKGGSKVIVSHSVGLVIANNSKHPDEAWELIKFITSEEVQRYLAQQGIMMPANKKLKGYWSNSAIFKKINLDVSAHERALEYAVPLDSSLDAAKWQNFEKKQMNKLWLGKISPEETGKSIAEYTNKLLEKEQKIINKLKSPQ